jgi:hypothetical protein
MINSRFFNIRDIIVIMGFAIIAHWLAVPLYKRIAGTDQSSTDIQGS